MKQLQLLALALFGLLAFSQTAFSQATLSVQGVIKNSDGTAVDNGKYSLTFRLYDVESGGTAVWYETQDNVQVTGGIYSALLGAATPMTAAFDKTYFLGLSVEGGAELIPRAKLTSSPYALSLIGTGNIFPSSGAIGAGTASPSAGYQLHTKSAAGSGRILLEGSTAAYIDFKKGGTYAALGFGSANNDFLVNPGANNTTIQYNGSTKLTVHSSGVDVAGSLNASSLGSLSTMNFTTDLKIGNTGGNHTFLDGNQLRAKNGGSNSILYLNYDGGGVNINSGLTVNSGATINNGLTVGGNLGSYFISTGTRYINAGEQGYSGFTSSSTAIKANGLIEATGGFYASSDRRIKTNFALSNGQRDLNLLNRLQVTDYQFIDKTAHGSKTVKGFVAQEVADVMPLATHAQKDFVPSIYALPTATKWAGNLLRVDLAKAHGLKKGDIVRLYTEKNTTQDLPVAEVLSENSFAVSGWAAGATAEKLFVYGQEVSDFRSIDFNQLTALNISATQELARKVEALEKENGALKGELKASAEKFEARLRALENKLSN